MTITLDHKQTQALLERTIAMLRHHAEKLTTPDDLYGGLMLFDDADYLEELRAALDAPQPEPVAWMLLLLHGMTQVFDKKNVAEMEFERLNNMYPDENRKVVPLYAAPPAKPQVDKSQWWYKELEGFWGNADYVVTFDTRRAVKVALDLARPPTVKESLSVQQPAREPLTDEQILNVLKSVDHETKRLPPGFREFARAIEQAHGIGGAA